MKRKSPTFPLKEPDFKALMIDPPIKELTCFAEAVNSLPSKIPKTRVPEDSFEKDFDINLSNSAKTRSIHNNIITFLVLFIMLSGHASFIWISQYNWIILSFLAIILGLIRHYFNLRAKKKI